MPEQEANMWTTVFIIHKPYFQYPETRDYQRDISYGQEKKLHIHGFSSEGYPVYPDKINGHFIWDVPEAHMCNLDCPTLSKELGKIAP